MQPHPWSLGTKVTTDDRPGTITTATLEQKGTLAGQYKYTIRLANGDDADVWSGDPRLQLAQ